MISGIHKIEKNNTQIKKAQMIGLIFMHNFLLSMT